tara:strand:- start:928 stop:1764 length:837 start_codon:yes stop_codon:yes gene_type:complete
MAEQIFEIQPSTIENIDLAVYEFINKNLDLFSSTNEGFKKIPVIWVGAERANQTKNNKDLRDDQDVLILPLTTLERTSITKNLDRKGTYWGNVGQDTGLIISRRIKQDKTANFLNADGAKKTSTGVGHGQINFPSKKDNKKIVYETIKSPLPVYIDLIYKFSVRTEYQEQMNKLITPFMTRPHGLNHIPLRRNSHYYEMFVGSDYGLNNNVAVMNEEERTYITDIELKVLGYLIGEEDNQKNPKIVKTENAVEVKLPRERVIFGDIPTHIDKKGFYSD